MVKNLKKRNGSSKNQKRKDLPRKRSNKRQKMDQIRSMIKKARRNQQIKDKQVKENPRVKKIHLNHLKRVVQFQIPNRQRRPQKIQIISLNRKEKIRRVIPKVKIQKKKMITLK